MSESSGSHRLSRNYGRLRRTLLVLAIVCRDEKGQRTADLFSDQRAAPDVAGARDTRN
jgi:hypothetical protein